MFEQMVPNAIGFTASRPLADIGFFSKAKNLIDRAWSDDRGRKPAAAPARRIRIESNSDAEPDLASGDARIPRPINAQSEKKIGKKT